jgi:ATP-binding cassette subfamily B protein
VLYDAPVLLLDEATSALDEETEQRVLKNLRELADKTCICISHRPAALQMCDRVLHIRDGAFEEGEP